MSTDTVPAGVRQQLEDERKALVSQLNELGRGEEGGLEYDTNFADVSQVTAERGEAAALAQSLEEALKEVDHALEKISLGTYGTCERCQQKIASARLEAKPTARFCIDCASAR